MKQLIKWTGKEVLANFAIAIVLVYSMFFFWWGVEANKLWWGIPTFMFHLILTISFCYVALASLSSWSENK